MTTTQAAAALGISAIRVRQLIIGGRLKAERVGRDWHIDPDSLHSVQNRRTGRPPVLDSCEKCGHLVRTRLLARSCDLHAQQNYGRRAVAPSHQLMFDWDPAR